MEKQQKDVTIKDVARRADVAISTVSRVLNGLDKVRPRQGSGSGRAVRELGYVPNSLAVSMVTGQTKAVMVVVPDFTNDFNGAVVQGAEEYLKEQGLHGAGAFGEGPFGGGLRVPLQKVLKACRRDAGGAGSPDLIDYGKWTKPFVMVDGYGREDGGLQRGDRQRGGGIPAYGGASEERPQKDRTHRRFSRRIPGRPPNRRLQKGAEREAGLSENSLVFIPAPILRRPATGE